MFDLCNVSSLFESLSWSGFNSALAIQVNTTRQDVRITKEKLREEERQNREAQQSLEDWSREVCKIEAVIWRILRIKFHIVPYFAREDFKFYFNYQFFSKFFKMMSAIFQVSSFTASHITSRLNPKDSSSSKRWPILMMTYDHLSQILRKFS